MFKMLGQAYGMQKNLNKVEEFLNDFMTFNEPYISSAVCPRSQKHRAGPRDGQHLRPQTH